MIHTRKRTGSSCHFCLQPQTSTSRRHHLQFLTTCCQIKPDKGLIWFKHLDFNWKQLIVTFLKRPAFVTGRFDSERLDSFVHIEPEFLVWGLELSSALLRNWNDGIMGSGILEWWV